MLCFVLQCSCDLFVCVCVYAGEGRRSREARIIRATGLSTHTTSLTIYSHSRDQYTVDEALSSIFISFNVTFIIEDVIELQDVTVYSVFLYKADHGLDTGVNVKP